jgi:hypothetical protein
MDGDQDQSESPIKRQVELLEKINADLAKEPHLENIEQIRKNAETIARLADFL